MKYSTAVSSSRRKSRKVRRRRESGRGGVPLGGAGAGPRRRRRGRRRPDRCQRGDPVCPAWPAPWRGPAPSSLLQETHAIAPLCREPQKGWALRDRSPRPRPKRRRRPPPAAAAAGCPSPPLSRAPHARSSPPSPPGPIHGPLGRPPQADVYLPVQGAARQALGELFFWWGRESAHDRFPAPRLGEACGQP